MKKSLVLISAVLLAVGLAYGAQNHVSDAGTVKYLNTSAKILSGAIVDLGYRYGVAGGDIASNSTGVVFTDGVWLLARANTNAIALGANVYQNSSSNVTGTAAGNKYLGECVEAVAVCTAVVDSDGKATEWVKVDIGAPQRQIIVGTDVQPYDADLTVLALGLASNKVWIGNNAGVPAQASFSGLFTTTTGGVVSATTTGLAWTNATAAVTVTPQAPSAVTPTITLIPLAPATVTPTITVTKQTGAVTASGANNLVTLTNYYNPTTETVSMTDTNGVTALMVTNILWSTAVYAVATNGAVAVTITGGGAVMTDATAACSALPDFATNATATCSTLPLFATNATATSALTHETSTFVKP